jgi:hypothetical protein
MSDEIESSMDRLEAAAIRRATPTVWRLVGVSKGRAGRTQIQPRERLAREQSELPANPPLGVTVVIGSGTCHGSIWSPNMWTAGCGGSSRSCTPLTHR